MVRTGMIRLGSALVVLASIGPPARGSLIRYHFPEGFAVAPPTPTAPRFAGALAFDGGRIGVDHDAPARPGEGFVFGLALGGGPRVGGGLPAHWMIGDPTEAESLPLRRPQAASPGRPWAPADDAPSWWAADGPPDGPAGEPPLALAACLGVAAWAVHRRCAGGRATPLPRARLATPARPAGTAIVLASRPAPEPRPPAIRTRRSAAATPLVLLPARFVEVSTTARPPALPAWGVGATSLVVGRRAGVLRLPA